MDKVEGMSARNKAVTFVLVPHGGDFAHTPACTTPEAFTDWLALQKVHLSHSSSSRPTIYCEDCTRGYQSKMKKQGKCERPDYKVEAW